MSPPADRRPGSIGIAGSGNIACGLAVACAPHLEVRLCARSDASASRAHRTIERMTGTDPVDIEVGTRFGALTGCSILVEAVAEDLKVKTGVLRELAALPGGAPLGTTTSSLPLANLARASGTADRLAALHFFSPVYRVPLVELAFPEGVTPAAAATARELCATIGKTAIEVPGVPGLVVNRVVFPMLLAAVETLELTELPPETIDEAMRLALGHPLGPLRTLDFIGIDIAVAIAERLRLDPPTTLREMISAGKLGRKAGCGFHAYGAPDG